MILGKVFGRFARYSPVTVMMRGLLEYVFPPSRLDELFREHAVAQYEDELLFSTVVDTLALAVHGVRSSVHTAYLACQEEFSVSVRSLYGKLQGVEPQVSRALVTESQERLAPVIRALRAELPPLLRGYRVKILDGNHLAATEHRIKQTRALNSAPLPGEALVLLDPQLRLILDVIPCEDGAADSLGHRKACATLWIPSKREYSSPHRIAPREAMRRLEFLDLQLKGSLWCKRRAKLDLFTECDRARQIDNGAVPGFHAVNVR